MPPPSRSLSLPTDLNWDDVKNLAPPPPVDPEVSREVRRRLEWRYPLGFFTTVRAKMSVGELKRRLDGDDDDESWRFLPRPTGRMGMDDAEGYSTAVERGIAVHAFLARVRLEMTHSPEALAAENARLVKAGYLRPPGLDPADIARVAAFFASPARSPYASPGECPPGTALTVLARQCLRSRPSTRRVPPGRRPASPERTIIAQGVIDMLLDEPDGSSYLTSRLTSQATKSLRSPAYTSQIALYALAAERILGSRYRRRHLFLGPLRRFRWTGCRTRGHED